MRDIVGGLIFGPCGPAKLRIRRNGEETTEDVNRVLGSTAPVRVRWVAAAESHELPGPAFRRLTDAISYLKISSLKAAAIPVYLEIAQSGKGLILDLRGAPSEAIWGDIVRLVNPGPFARATIGDLSNPGAFEWDEDHLRHVPGARSSLKIVVLTDERTQSNVEYAEMALRSDPDVLAVGSATAGADGNVSYLVLPGDLQVRFTGIGIFYPDGRPTQRIGLVPDVLVTPTIAGIAAGRDEVLEEAERRLAKMIQ